MLFCHFVVVLGGVLYNSYITGMRDIWHLLHRIATATKGLVYT